MQSRDEQSDLGHGHATRLATERLRELILEGDLLPGSRISERVMQERLGVTRTPLREALKVLSVEGIVSLVPNRGAVVTELTIDDVRAAFELLGLLDGMAGELAAERASDEAIAGIVDLHHEMVACWRMRDLPGYFRLNKQVHLAIVDAASNPALSRVYRAESARVDRLRYISNREASVWARSIRQHEQILDALTARQGALLREALVSHRRSGWELAQATLARRSDPCHETRSSIPRPAVIRSDRDR